MYRLLCLLVLVSTSCAAKPKVPTEKLNNPRAVAVNLGGQTFVAVAGEVGKNGDGAVLFLENGKTRAFAAGLNDPSTLVSFQDKLFAIDGMRIVRIDKKGKVENWVTSYPIVPKGIDALAVDAEKGNLYFSDTKGGTVFSVDPKGKTKVVVDRTTLPAIQAPAGLVTDGFSHLLVADAKTGALHRVKIGKGTSEKVADGVGSGDHLAWDKFGRLFIVDRKGDQILILPRAGQKPVRMAKFSSPGNAGLAADGHHLLVPDARNSTLKPVAIKVPGAEVDTTPLPLETTLAFENIKWTGWDPVTPEGKVMPLRPIILTHAGDGSNRIFVATQRGVIHTFPDDDQAKATKIFLDIQDRVSYNDKTNEEGFLGLAFPNDFKKTGAFYVFYTPKDRKLVNVISRFRMSKTDPDKADPASEEELFSIKRPFWNHDGGTIAFGPDGYLYVALGDGGSANDPFKNGQNLKTLLGSIMRIDVSKKGKDTPYAIPKDNPFVGKKDARPEIWAYGFRNVWRLSFDRKTGRLWAADVGQNLFEEIDIVKKGGNYGWNLREATHPFGVPGVGPREDMIDPVWEYHHDIGKSITGGPVYRGKKIPELDGAYLYADYISGRFWALYNDEKQDRVVANRPIKDRSLPILSFGEDEKGEVYLLTYSNSGKGIYRIQKGK